MIQVCAVKHNVVPFLYPCKCCCGNVATNKLKSKLLPRKDLLSTGDNSFSTHALPVQKSSSQSACIYFSICLQSIALHLIPHCALLIAAQTLLSTSVSLDSMLLCTELPVTKTGSKTFGKKNQKKKQHAC